MFLERMLEKKKSFLQNEKNQVNMIKITKETVYDPIKKHMFKVELSDEFRLLSEETFIVRFQKINGSDYWEHEIRFGSWVTWVGGPVSRWDILLMDMGRNIIFKEDFNTLIDGESLDKMFNLYCKIKKSTKGIVIGSHDGTWGHWVQSVIENDTNALIIEGSKRQYDILCDFYKDFKNCELVNKIVTVEGGNVEWFTGGNGFTDSVKKSTLQKFLDDNEITKEVKETYPINELVEEYGYQDYDWLHMDIEGYDAELIMGLKYLPKKFIIFENEHCKTLGTYNGVINFLELKGYKTFDYDGDTLAIR